MMNKDALKKFFTDNKKVILIVSILIVVIGIICGIVSWILMMDKKIEEGVQDSTDNKVNKEEVIDNNVVEKDGYRTIALLGIDAGEEGVPRSDTIMLANINENTGEIQLVSLYRDSFLYIEDWSKRSVAIDGEVDYTKINHAYQMGVDKTLKALNQNLALHITDYVAVDFITVARIVDAVGGIEVTIPDKANFIYYLNGMGRQAASMAGEKYKELSNSKRGKTVTLDGFQALGYCRVRKGNVDGYPLKGESDYTRAARQQEVINKVVDKIKSEGLTNGISLIDELVDICGNKENMSTSFSYDEIKELAVDALKKGYSLSDGGKLQFPFKPHEVKMWKGVRKNYVSSQFSDTSLIDDVKELHALLYPDKELTEEELERVEEISDQLEIYEKRFCDEEYYKPPITPTPAPTASAKTGETMKPTASAKARETVSPTAGAKVR